MVYPAKAVGRNEMQFGRDTRMVPNNILVDGASVPYRKRRFGVGTPVCSNAVGRNEMQFGRDTRMVPNNILVDGASVPYRKRRFGVGTPSLQQCCLLP